VRADALASLHKQSCVAETVVPQAFLQFRHGADQATPMRRDHATRVRGRTARRARRSATRIVVVHHSLSGFAVFCVLL
jgi:hypothetical protein